MSRIKLTVLAVLVVMMLSLGSTFIAGVSAAFAAQPTSPNETACSHTHAPDHATDTALDHAADNAAVNC